MKMSKNERNNFMENKLTRIYPKMFTWLFIGLLITFISGYGLSLFPIITAKLLFIGIIPIIIVELVISVLMGFRIRKMNKSTAIICYLIYCVTTGITFSSIFLRYEMFSLMSIFIITALIFAALACYGYKTKKDLSKFGVILLFTLIITIITSIINCLLFKNSYVEIAITGISTLVFTFFIAYDINIIKNLADEIGEEKLPIFGAFNLYLDFINLFVRLLELFGKEKD